MLNPDAQETENCPPIVASAVINHLRARRRALASPKLRLVRVLDCPHTGRYPFELCDGVWGRAGKRIGNEFHQIRYDFLRSTTPGSIDPTLVHDLDISVDDFTFSVAEDLQILLEERDQRQTRRLHIRALSSNAAHPLAKLPFLEICQKDCPAWNHCALILHGIYLGIVLTGVTWQSIGCPGGVIIWNWVSGDILLPYRSALDATFISRNHLLLLVDANPSLGLEVISLNSDAKTQVLGLPMPRDFYGAHFVTHPFYNTRLGTNVPRVTNSSDHKVPLLVPDPEMDVAVLEYQYTDTMDERDGQLMVISARHLIDLCRIQQPGAAIAEPQQTKVTPWGDWGNIAARWLPCGMIKTSRRVAFGSRLLVAAHIDTNATNNSSISDTEEDLGEPTARFIVLDFNPRSLSRTEGLGSAAKAYVEALVKEIEKWSPKSPIPWSHDSAFNFQAAVLEDYGDYLNVYFDGDGFVGRQEDCYDVYSFLPLVLD